MKISRKRKQENIQFATTSINDMTMFFTEISSGIGQNNRDFACHLLLVFRLNQSRTLSYYLIFFLRTFANNYKEIVFKFCLYHQAFYNALSVGIHCLKGQKIKTVQLLSINFWTKFRRPIKFSWTCLSFLPCLFRVIYVNSIYSYNRYFLYVKLLVYW